MINRIDFGLIKKAIYSMGILILIITVITSLLLNYSNIIALSTGIIIWFIFIFLSKVPKQTIKKSLLITIVIIIFVIIGFFIYLISRPPVWAFIDYCYNYQYQVYATPETYQLDNIELEEYLVRNMHEVGSLQKTKVTIKKHGFLLNEVVIHPVVSCADAHGLKSLVTLSDFPINSFYAAYHAQELQKSPYLETETITWTSSGAMIKFLFIPPPYQHLRHLLAPLFGVSHAGQWIYGILGLLSAYIFMPYMLPVLREMMESTLKRRLLNANKTEKQTAKIITNDKGDEIEIEISKGKRSR